MDSHSNYSKFKRVIKRLIWLIPLIWPEGKERWITWFIPVHLIGQLKGLVSSRDDFNQTKMIIAVELKFFADSNIFLTYLWPMAKIPSIETGKIYLHIRSEKTSDQTKQIVRWNSFIFNPLFIFFFKIEKLDHFWKNHNFSYFWVGFFHVLYRWRKSFTWFLSSTFSVFWRFSRWMFTFMDL